MIRSYSELISLESFEDRFNYLKLDGTVSDVTFGGHRYLNQRFYNKDLEWKESRDYVILRDLGYDLAHSDFPIGGIIIVHHMNPLTINDIQYRTRFLLDPEYLICTSIRTHNAIHFGDYSLINNSVTIRSKNDTCPWKA